MTKDMAVELQGVTKRYDRLIGKKSTLALNNIDLQVPAGQIFGLLGPSGCGKTTLLRCVVGRIKPNEGTITVLNKRAGDPDSGVPGHNVGYMPQELSLVFELTIAETFEYFGHLVGMDNSRLKQHKDFLINMLHLPEEMRLIRDLSGGEKRRVSFAVALLHQPRLLVLDEPTVGVDPLLRVSIWEHLLTVARDAGTTIIITTHYIEEARRAHTIGLMRQGRLLVQSPPDQLLHTHQMTSLEAIFLHLCREDDKHASSNVANGSVTIFNNGIYRDQSIPTNTTSQSLEKPKLNIKSCLYKRLKRIQALTHRNFLMTWRNHMNLLLQIIVPTLCIILVILSLNDTYHDLDIGVANADEGFFGSLYLEQLDSDSLCKIEHQSRESALESAKQHDTWGFIYINPNFTEATLQRFHSGVNASNETVSMSSIVVQMDMTQYQVAYYIQKELVMSYNDFTVDLLEDYNLNPASVESPISFEKPIYGDSNPKFVKASMPGFLVHVTFCFAALLTSLAFVGENTNGILDRAWVSGITRTDVTISHFLVQGAVMICQITIEIVTFFWICQMPCEGSVILVIFIIFLVGICAITFGFLISTIVPHESAAIMAQIVWFLATTFIIGSIWPLEAMPQWLMYTAYIVPQTLPTQAIKSVMLRGWTIQHLQVWLPCLTTMIWTSVNIALSQIIIHLRS